MKRFISLLLVLCLTAALGGCQKITIDLPLAESSKVTEEQPAPQPAVIDTVRVPWQSDDTLNPYTCQTLQNFYLGGLLYDSLVALDESYTPQKRLAQEIVCEDGKRYEIHIRGDALFWDGTTVTAADVAASLELARNTPRFAAALKNIASVEIPTDSTVIINLATPDVLFDRSLTFAVFKAGSGSVEDPLALPIGGGRYRISDNGQSLVANSSYYEPVKRVKTVELVAVQSLEDQSYGILDGTIDLMYSDMRGDLNLGLGTSYRQIPMNNLVYLSVNAKKTLLDTSFRRAISDIVNRDDIVRKAYLGFGAATASVFNPAYGNVSLESAPLEDIQLEEVARRLDEMGFVQRDAAGYRMANGTRIHLTILVNKENSDRESAAQLIAAALTQAGIEAVVDKVSYEEFKRRIAEEQYDLYIGEMKIPYNSDILGIISTDTALNPGVVEDAQVSAAYGSAKAGEMSLGALDTLLRQKMPVIPLLFRRGILCFSRDFSVNMVATEQDIFYNIVDW